MLSLHTGLNAKSSYDRYVRKMWVAPNMIAKQTLLEIPRLCDCSFNTWATAQEYDIDLNVNRYLNLNSIMV